MKAIIRHMLIFSLIAITSCLRDTFPDTDPLPGDGEKDVTLNLSLPCVAPRPGTRAIGAAQENAIETLDVLAFKVEEGVETFQYRVEARRGAGSVAGASRQTFTARLRVREYEQRFVLIGNARSKVETLINSRPIAEWSEVGKEEMLSQLTAGLNGSDRWNAASGVNFTAIPLWSETAPEIISETTTFVNERAIPMLRMLAKVEVQLDKSVSGLTNIFKLKSVHVYNTNTSGRIVPLPGYVGPNMVARKASLPETVSSVVGPLPYTDFNAHGETDIAMRGAIYLFETDAKNAGDFLEETCIVAGGFYGDDKKETYYRIDFFASGSSTHMDILRNHRYVCNITNVKGPGHNTVDEAFHSKTYDLETDILVWDDTEIDVIIFDAQHMLGVSENPVYLSSSAQTASSTNNILKILTDHPAGWTATVYNDMAGTGPSSWLTISPGSGASSVIGAMPDEIRLLTGVNDKFERMAFVHIKAGNLTCIVTVIQDSNNTDEATITLSPEEYLLPFMIPVGATFPVHVSSLLSDGSENISATWTLRSNDPAWCLLSENPATPFSSASATLLGTGSKTVYLIVKDNDAILPRTTTVKIGSLTSDVAVNIKQFGSPAGITDNEGAGTPPAGAITYVGAFWRAGQMGERLIRIDVSANRANWGEWTAQVMWMDGRWSSGDIVLSTQESTDPQKYTLYPGDAENFPVEGNETIITGDVVNGYIKFRIGLKSAYTSTTLHPARYAVVLLSYGGKTKKHQKLFLRQGEEADYLMHPEDPGVIGGAMSLSRPYAKMWAPYNLTATTIDAMVPVRGGIFVNYPTQAGALWQWANPFDYSYTYTPPRVGMRWAFNQHRKEDYPGWSTGMSSDFWNTLAADHEVSPPGYRRPNDGSITALETKYAADNSEFRQSLFQTPKASVNYANDIANSIWGYYADGFFDRRPIENSINGAANTSVTPGTRDCAHLGRLFFNPLAASKRFQASVFFPIATAVRGWNRGQFEDTAIAQGWYWTSSATRSDKFEGLALHLRFFDDRASMWRSDKYWCMMIRPVKE